MACGGGTRLYFEPQLDEKGEHTIVVISDETTVTCMFEIGDHVTPLDDICDGPTVNLMIASDVPNDSPTAGPENKLPIVEGVSLHGIVEEITVEVDGTSYGPITTENVEATEDDCSHNAATVQLD